MIFAIGDIHGELSKLQKLIHKILKIDNNCKLIFVGDYLDKGENSKIVLDYLENLKWDLDCTFLIGNHEFYWLNGNLQNDEYLLRFGGKQTIKSFKCKTVEETRLKLLNDYQKFFENLIPYYIFGNYFISHSGFNPLIKENDISEIDINNLLFNRYDFLKSNKFFLKKYKVVFGHTAFFEPCVDQFKIGIDTGACFLKNQPLTSFCLDNNFFLNSNGCITNLSECSDSFCPSIIRNTPWRE